MSFIDRQIINLLVEDLRRDLALTDTAISLLQGLAFAMFYAACAVPLGRLADSSSRKALIATGLCAWTAATAACGLAGNFVQLFCARVLVGAGEATLTPCTFSMLADLFKPQRLALPCGVYTASSFVGSGIALLAGGALLSHLATTGGITLPGFGPLKVWQAAFLLAAAPGVLVWLLLVFTVSEPARRGLQPRDATAARPALGELLSFYQANTQTLNAVFFGVALLGAVQFSIGAWAPAYFMRVHGWTAGQVGAAYGPVLLVCGSGGAIAGGWLANHLESRYGQGHLRAALASAIATLPFAAAFPLASSGAAAAWLLVPTVFLGSLSLGAGPALIPVFAPPRMRGVMIAMYVFVASLIGQAGGPWLVAASTQYLFGAPERVRDSLVLVPSAMLLLSAVFIGLGIRSQRRSSVLRAA